ncbi:MAG: DUF4037 domain-containing protein [Candidatus Promineifilaceae bacterium]|nr:DUF4037 domain-containing protein [Candidatus Promineifilaceae bacterium]
MSESIIDVSQDFFREIILPILDREFPTETKQTAFGVFGYGSEVLRLDDEYSSDHHWGLRINALIPDYLVEIRKDRMLQAVADNLPQSYRGHSLREGYTGVAGLEIDSLEGFLKRTIGMISPPETYAEWLNIPEEDIIHVINGEIWHDASGCFTNIRRSFANYYPEEVRLRRIAHWCRYFSGMGTYALKRALLRGNEYYAAVAFGKSIRWGVQLAFMLDKQYYPYDKWIMAMFSKLPRMAEPLLPIVDEAVRLSTSWKRKYELLNQMADVLDQAMVNDGIIKPHPEYNESSTSGYRLLEHAYAEIIQGLPDEIIEIVPVWDQIHLEAFHSAYVNTIDLAVWDDILNLRPIGNE